MPSLHRANLHAGAIDMQQLRCNTADAGDRQADPADAEYQGVEEMRRIHATSRPSETGARVVPMDPHDHYVWKATRQRHPHWYAEMRHEEAALAKSLGVEPEPGMTIGIGWAFAALFCLLVWGAIAWAVL